MDSCVEKGKALCRALLDSVNGPEQFFCRVGCRLTQVDADGTAAGELAVAPENLNPWQTVHGGALACLADTVTGAAVAAATGRACVTADYSMSYLRPATGAKIVCAARPEKLGSRLCVMRAELTNERGETVAIGTFTYCLTEPLS